MTKPTVDIYQNVTDRIIDAIEAGLMPWRRPWAGSPPEWQRPTEATDMDALAHSVGAIVHHGGCRSYYSTIGDFVAMPPRCAFKSTDDYQSLLAHELIHWTGRRCARDLSTRFGGNAYAFEELVAEIGSAFLCARHGIALESLQHASYVDNWLRVLKADKRAIFTAASQAKKAAEFLAASKHEEKMQSYGQRSTSATSKPSAASTPQCPPASHSPA